MTAGCTVPGIIVPHISPISCLLMTSQKWQCKMCSDFHCTWQILDQLPLMCPWNRWAQRHLAQMPTVTAACLQQPRGPWVRKRPKRKCEMSKVTFSSYTTFIAGGRPEIPTSTKTASCISEVGWPFYLPKLTLQRRMESLGVWQTDQPPVAHFHSGLWPPHLSSCSDGCSFEN